MPNRGVGKEKKKTKSKLENGGLGGVNSDGVKHTNEKCSKSPQKADQKSLEKNGGTVRWKKKDGSCAKWSRKEKDKGQKNGNT